MKDTVDLTPDEINNLTPSQLSRHMAALFDDIQAAVQGTPAYQDMTDQLVRLTEREIAIESNATQAKADAVQAEADRYKGVVDPEDSDTHRNDLRKTIADIDVALESAPENASLLAAKRIHEEMLQSSIDATLEHKAQAERAAEVEQQLQDLALERGTMPI